MDTDANPGRGVDRGLVDDLIIAMSEFADLAQIVSDVPEQQRTNAHQGSIRSASHKLIRAWLPLLLESAWIEAAPPTLCSGVTAGFEAVVPVLEQSGYPRMPFTNSAGESFGFPVDIDSPFMLTIAPDQLQAIRAAIGILVVARGQLPDPQAGRKAVAQYKDATVLEGGRLVVGNLEFRLEPEELAFVVEVIRSGKYGASKSDLQESHELLKPFTRFDRLRDQIAEKHPAIGRHIPGGKGGRYRWE